METHSCFFDPARCFSIPPERRHLERSASPIYRHQRALRRKVEGPGDVCWQMLFGAFRPQTTREIKKDTASDRKEA